MRPDSKTLLVLIAALSVAVGACSGAAAPTATTAPTSPPTATAPTTTPLALATTAATATVPASPTAGPATTTSNAAPTATTAANATSAAQSSTAPTGSLQYNVVASDTKADFRVREQLARLPLPSDAVGTSSNITGSLVLDAAGKVNSDLSKFVIDMTSFHTDSAMRDGYIRRSTLDTTQYPTAVFVPTTLQGLPAPLPTSGQQSFKLLGNLTVHGVTKPVTWNVTSKVAGNDVTGQATTDVTFEDFGMSPPKTGAVLSVTDEVKLELSFHLARSA